MISAILVDDEMHAIKGLTSMVGLFCPDIQIAGHSTSIEEAKSLIAQKDPDLVFLDMEMADGVGFDILHKTVDARFMTIVVTAHENYALQAIKQNVVDYLLKPIDPDDLVSAVVKTRKKILAQQIFNRGHSIEPEGITRFRKIGLRTSKCIVYIPLDDILRLEASDNYTYVYTIEAQYLVTKTLKSFELQLPSDTFIRCHQSHIVNLYHIEGYDRSEGSNLVIHKNHIVPVSRANKSRLERFLNRFFPSI